MSTLEKYPAYKDSGVEWLGEIPEGWEIKKLKYVVKVHSGNGFPIDEQGNNDGKIPFFKVSDINGQNIYVSQSNNYVSANTVKNKKWNFIPSGSIVTAKIGEALRKNHRKITNGLSIIDNNCIAFEPKGIETKFNYYLHKTIDFDWFSNVGAVPSISVSGYKNFKAFIPPKQEQTKIASFLDEKTSQLDTAIEQKEQLIKLLKERRQILINDAVTKGLDKTVAMKDSRVEWIGEIPEEWTKVKLKWISKRYAGGTPDKNNLKFWENGTIPWIASGEVNQGIVTKPTTKITEQGLKYSSARWIPRNSLIVALAGQGKTKGMVAYLDIDTTGNQSLSAVIPNKKKISSKYMYYFIKAAYKELRGSAGDGQRDGLNLEKLGVLNIVYPPKQEQEKIVNYIEKNNQKIDKAINLQEQQITKLKEYKASLIDSVVTGKVKVS